MSAKQSVRIMMITLPIAACAAMHNNERPCSSKFIWPAIDAGAAAR
eukprot:COSAG01_NODE_6790_length_3496_cov_3.344127_1_plen_46_part_00